MKNEQLSSYIIIIVSNYPNKKMKYNKLGNTDIEVSEICLGTMTFGEQNTEAEAHEQLDYSMDNGVNFIDTAEMYAVPGRMETQGQTEKYIGSWIKYSSKRDKIILATKVTGPSAGLKYISNLELGFNKDRMDEALHNSLERLQTDHIDLYQLHWPERNSNIFSQRGWNHEIKEEWQYNIDQVVQRLNGYIKAGKIRHYGLSNETPWGVMQYLQESDSQNLRRPVSIQNPYGLLNRTYEVGMAEISYREKVGLLAYSPMGFGLLSGKYHKKQDKPTDRLNKFKQMARYNSDQSYEATSKYLSIAESHDISLAAMSLAYMRSKPWITSTIIGATNMEQLKENIDSATIALNPSWLKQVEKVHKAIPNPAP